VDAFLLAAGLGTRLRPLTDHKPKPLIEVSGRPLIDRNLEILKKIGCNRVMINTHYLAEQIYEYVGDGSKWGLEIVYSYEKDLLDTGGGLKNIFEYLTSDYFITWNADVLIDPIFASSMDGFVDLKKTSEKSPRPIITLLVREESEEVIKSYGELIIDKDQNLIGFLGTNFRKVENSSKKVIFCGISIMSREVYAYFPKDEPIFSLTKDIFPKILSDEKLQINGKINVSYCNCYWNDVGTPKSLELASYKLK
jgi:NDP-sugar pyrophosphorylase family protein